jgi:hypothetical protein
MGMTKAQRETMQRFVNDPFHRGVDDGRGNIVVGHELSPAQQLTQRFLDEDAANPDPREPFTYYVVAE